MARAAQWAALGLALLVVAVCAEPLGAQGKNYDWWDEEVSQVDPNFVTLKKGGHVLIMTDATKITIPGQEGVTRKTLPNFLKPGDRVDATGVREGGKEKEYVCRTLVKK
jgi:hypothetical protein